MMVTMRIKSKLKILLANSIYIFRRFNLNGLSSLIMIQLNKITKLHDQNNQYTNGNMGGLRLWCSRIIAGVRGMGGLKKSTIKCMGPIRTEYG